jgi:hypothetical protein
VLVAGGVGGHAGSSAEVFAFASNSWQRLPSPLSVERSCFGMCYVRHTHALFYLFSMTSVRAHYSRSPLPRITDHHPNIRGRWTER